MFESRISAGRVEKLPFPQSTRISSWSYDMTWWVMQRSVWNDIVNWRTRRLSNSTKYLLHASMITTSKKKKMESVRELSKVCSPNCSKMFPPGKNSTTRFFMVSKQTRTGHNKMDQDLWQTPESTDFIYSSHKWIQTTLSCGKYCWAMQIGTVSGLWFCGRSWRFKIHFGVNIMCFRKSHICSNKLDVQETSISFSQFNRIWNCLTGHKTEIGWFACSGTVGSNCFCSWKCFSCFRSIGETWEWWSQTPQVSQ